MTWRSPLSFCISFLATVSASVAGAIPDFPAVYNSETSHAELPSAQQAQAAITLPEGFHASVFAAEPDVQNPIAMAWDARGRLWVAENYTYAERSKRFDLTLHDRLLIFSGTTSNHFVSRKVFSDNLQCLTSIEVGLGGAWVLCPPRLLFIPDRNGDDVPDSSPEVLLDGFTIPTDNYHNFANGLRWGPDGWLYGRCGCSAPGEVGKPGTPASGRIPLRGGIWRYHPTRKIFEVVSHGTMNPWGMDWNELGEAFFVNTVSGHLWHVIPGAHFTTAHSFDPNARTYSLIDMHADHWHFETEKGWMSSRDGAANSLGGGHAHCGAMVYLGDNWPAAYRGNLFTLNYHGRRANQEILERSGSGYVGHHGTDQFLFGDSWFRGLDLGYGPDGGVFVLDWSDTGECHESTGVHRTSGRIYKIAYGQPRKVTNFDLAKSSIPELLHLQSHTNEWFVRQARLEFAARTNKLDASEVLYADFDKATAPTAKLRTLWALNAAGALNEEFLLAQLSAENEHVRTWTIRLLTDNWPLDTIMSARPAREANDLPKTVIGALTRLAETEQSAMVRLALASTLQRLPLTDRLPLARGLLSHAEDASDHNLPQMIWFGLIPCFQNLDSASGLQPADRALAQLAADSRIPLVRRFIARALAEDMQKQPHGINELLSLTRDKSDKIKGDVLGGMTEGLKGWSKADMPPAWPEFQASLPKGTNQTLARRATELSVVFGDGRAVEDLKKLVTDSKADLSARRSALETLINKRAPDLRELCEGALKVRYLNVAALHGLALFDAPEVGLQLAASYRQFHAADRPAVIETLASRPTYASALLDEVAVGHIARNDLTAFHARQIHSFGSAELSARLGQVWGNVQSSTPESRKAIAKWKEKLTPQFLGAADLANGRRVFTNTCAVCHTLYGEGGRVGPDLTGGDRFNLDYLLENIITPSAVVNVDFQMSIFELKDGRTLNGIIAGKTDRTISVKTMTELVSIERAQIESTRKSTLSLMPEGLLETLSETQVRDLFAYLMSR